MAGDHLTVRWLGQQDYLSCWQAMQTFTNQRQSDTSDEVWLLQHDPVFTQGQNGKPEHLLNPGSIPVVQTDRGGQITYHGPGQLILYPLIDLKRKKLSVRALVCLLETMVIDYLSSQGINALANLKAPGVYVHNEDDQEKKICSIGLRIRKGCSYHGIAFNIAMDLSPFGRINPCGFSQLKMTQLSDFVPVQPPITAVFEVGRALTQILQEKLMYTQLTWL